MEHPVGCRLSRLDPHQLPSPSWGRYLPPGLSPLYACMHTGVICQCVLLMSCLVHLHASIVKQADKMQAHAAVYSPVPSFRLDRHRRAWMDPLDCLAAPGPGPQSFEPNLARQAPGGACREPCPGGACRGECLHSTTCQVVCLCWRAFGRPCAPCSTNTNTAARLGELQQNTTKQMVVAGGYELN